MSRSGTCCTFPGIVFFCYFYTSIVFNPTEVADNMRKYGGFIPGIRPGKKTAEYVETILTRITFAGAIYLALIAIIPEFMITGFHIHHLPVDREILRWLAVMAVEWHGRAVRLRRHLFVDRRGRRDGHGAADRSAVGDAALRWISRAARSKNSRETWVSRPLVIVFLGPPGSGKGTQSRILSETLSDSSCVNRRSVA